METKEPTMMEAPAKKGMRIAVGPGDYQSAPPKYVRAYKDSMDGQDPDEDEDIEAPYLVPKQNPIPKTPQDEQTSPAPPKGNSASAEDSQVPSGEESIPELINLREEEEVPPPSPSKRAHCPTTLGLDKKMTAPAERPPIPPTPILKGKTETRMALVASPKMHIERQVDHLLMPPPVDTTLIAQRPPMPQQPPKELEKRGLSPGTIEKKTLHKRRRGKLMMPNNHAVAKMHTGQAESRHAQELARLASTVVPLQKLNI